MCPVPLGIIGADQYCDRCRPRAGEADDAVKLEPEREIVALPHWCRGVSYQSAHDLIITSVLIPTDRGTVQVNFESVADDAEALARALLTCVERSRRSSEILDVPSDDSSSTPRPPRV